MPRAAARRRPAAEPAFVPVLPNEMPSNVIVLVDWKALHESPLNPRRHRDPDRLRKMMDSIERLGLETNLVVRPDPLHPGDYEIVIGNRRREAIEQLVAEGRLPAEFLVAVKIREMTDVELVGRAMNENLQHEDLKGWEEADGFLWLAEKGGLPVEAIAAEVDRSPRFVRDALVLATRLGADARREWEAGRINKAQAQAFTVGEKPDQAKLLRHVVNHPQSYTAADIRTALLGKDVVRMSEAIFDKARYPKSKLIQDLIEEEGYATDRAEFRRLQLAACEARRDELLKTWSWVEIETGDDPALWSYDRDGAPALAGVIIHLRKDNLRVVERSGLVRRPAAAPQSAANGKTTDAEGSFAEGAAGAPEPPLSREHLIWAWQEKTRAQQDAIGDDQAVAAALDILDLAVAGPPNEVANPALKARQAKLLAEAGLPPPGQISPDRAAAHFRALMALPPARREALRAALVAARYGSTWAGFNLDLGDSELAIAIAEETGIARRPLNFTLSSVYLERLGREQLVRVARACGVKQPLGEARGEIIDTILLSPDRDPAWFPPELTFATKAEILAGLTTAAEPTTAAA